MVERNCPKCGGLLIELDEEYVLLSGKDVPAFGSKAEIMVTPRNSLRVRVHRCENPACLFVELAAS
jgi:hypothetical protein